MPLQRFNSSCQVYDKSNEDRLVDAAVAWEALFGSQDDDQLTLQIALGTAWLREPSDYAKRDQVFTTAKKIYGLRSKVIHGGSPKAKDVEEAAATLVEWLREMLVALMSTHRPLIDPKNRTRRLMLGDPSIAEPE